MLAVSTSRSVHPHARGDDAAGTRRDARRTRFTPTRVGTTTATMHGSRRAVGSPPRAWGLRPRCRQPASLTTVHPHARGDDAVEVAGCRCTMHGSPPRAWGIRSAQRTASTRQRFTPTRVGNDAGTSAVHVARERFTPTRVGTTSTQCRRSTPAARFTPTRVGNTASRVEPGEHCRSVHPHARGDDAGARSLDSVRPRFTPTRVGTTRQRRRIDTVEPVHPHARGDDVLRRRPAMAAARFTPTRVGTTS